MLHVTGGGSMKLHGLKKDHIHWTQVAGAAGTAASPPPEATAADASPPKTASTNGDGDIFLLVGSSFPVSSLVPPPLTRIYPPCHHLPARNFPLRQPPPLHLYPSRRRRRRGCRYYPLIAPPLARIYPRQHSPPEHPCHHLPTRVHLYPSRRHRCRRRRCYYPLIAQPARVRRRRVRRRRRMRR